MSSSTSSRFAAFCIRHRLFVVMALVISTTAMGFFASRIQIKTVFADMVPTHHPWIQTSEQYKNTFGGENVITIMVKAREGTIFTQNILQKIQDVSRKLRLVHGINSETIMSLASPNLQSVITTSSSVETVPLMSPHVPDTQAEIDQLRENVVRNPLALGHYVSEDLTSALITADFIDRLVDYKTIFPEVNDLISQETGHDVEIYVVGQPMLFGWVDHYLGQTGLIFFITLAALMVLLFILNRSYRGTLLPLVSGAVSATWAVGIADLVGFNLDPLVVVVAFLITARSVSHSVQLVTRFDDIRHKHPDIPSARAAEFSMAELLRPGSVGILADAAAMLVVLLTPIPLLQKISIIGTVWVGTIFISAVVLTPVLLSWLGPVVRPAHRLDLSGLMSRFLFLCFRLGTGKARYAVVGGAAIILGIGGYLALAISVGDVHPGSAILKSGSTYNQSAAAINHLFPGANRLYVVIQGDKPGAIHSPETLNTIALFQRDMARQSDVGGGSSLVDVIASTNQALHGGDPRYYSIGNTAVQNGQFAYMYFSHSASSAIEQYATTDYKDAAVSFLFRNHTGQTIRTAFHGVEEFIAANPLEGANYKLAGGLIGVTAAVNDVLLRGQMEAIALGLLVVVLCAMVVYRSVAAGLYFMVPVLLSNTVTFAYMTIHNIGLNINTVPIVALGIGLGVDYSFYIADGIKDDLREHNDPLLAVRNALQSAGKGVFVTGFALVATVFFWTFSSLRFQAEMGELIALWLFVSAASALIIMPALAWMFRPKFIFGNHALSTTSDSMYHPPLTTASQ